MRKISIWARAAAAIFCAIAIVVAPMAQAKSAQEIFAAVAAGVVVVFALDETGEQIGQGSGVVVGENEVVTNCHVVSDASAVAVRQAADSRGRQTYLMDARMAARDEERDLCLLFVSELSEPPAAIPTAAGRARDLSIGEEVFAVGAPRGLDLSLTRGIVSQLRGDFGKKSAPVIQTDAAISPGSSGGGLFNEDGKLVGITTYKLSGDGSEGLSFAMPAEWVTALQAQAEKEIADEQKRQKCLSSPMVDCLFEIALQTAEKIEDANDHASALRNIAAAFAETGHGVDAKNTFANALQAIEKIEDAIYRDLNLRDITFAFAKAGLFPDALRTAKKIEDADDRASALRNIAAAFVEAGLFPNALRTAKKIEDADDRASALRNIAAAFAEAGLFSDALRTAEKIEGADDRASALRNIATAFAEAGLFSDALRTAEKIEGALYHAFALLNIAAAFAEAGHSVDAKNTFASALRTAEKIEKANDRVSALRYIAAAFAEAGHSVDAKNTFANALRTAEKIENTNDRASALRDIATAFAEAGYSVDAKNTFANAVRTAEKLEVRELFSIRASALHYIAAAFVEAGLFSNALQTVEKIKYALNRVFVLLDIATAFAEAGHSVDAKNTFGNALRTAEKIEDGRVFVLYNIAVAQAKAGHSVGAKNTFANALRTAEKIEDADDRASALRNIAAAFAEAGDIKNAIETSAKIGDETIFVSALTRIAVALAKAG